MVAHFTAGRSRLVWRLGDLLEQHIGEFAELEALDNGNPVTNARKGDLPGSINILRYMAGWATRSDLGRMVGKLDIEKLRAAE